MNRKFGLLFVLISLNLVLTPLIASNYNSNTEINPAAIKWNVEKGDKFTWNVTKSKSKNYNFSPVGTTFELEINSIQTTASASKLFVTLKKINDKGKSTTLLNNELFTMYNQTSAISELYEPFFDKGLIVPVAFSDYLGNLYNYYQTHLGIDSSGTQYSNNILQYFYFVNYTNSLEVSWGFDGDTYVADELEVLEYSEVTYLLELVEEEEDDELPDYTWVIILVVSIIAAVGVTAGFLYVKYRRTGTISFKRKTLGTSSSVSIKAEKKETSIKPKPAGTPESKDITAEEKQEIEQTESEMDIQTKELTCIVHKGPIKGATYACPNCQTLYCQNCAQVLKEKGESCWLCKHEIEL